ncbi:MAG: hypothetical protein CTY32_08590 [Methylotenera sp.]|nr:MAG: hypothetical protein CTY32_08590 [Methylotenera sp.]
MSILNILTKKSPKLGVFSFDAALEDNFEATVELTDYPVESGVKVSDHRIIQPVKYSIVGAVSNNPLKITPIDFLAGAITNVLPDSGVLATVAGISSAYLSGSDSTRASTALEFLIEMIRTGEIMTVDAVDIQLSNMIVTKISRTRDPENENGLIFVADLQELISLNRLPNQNQPTQGQLPNGDPAKSAAAATVNKGQKIGTDANVVISKLVTQANIVGVPN